MLQNVTDRLTTQELFDAGAGHHSLAAGSRIAEVSAIGMGDPPAIPLWNGEGDLPTPGFIRAAATAALQAGHTFYTHKAGLPELRATIADYLTGLHRRLQPLLD